MNIGILSRSAHLYSTKSLYQAGLRNNHEMYIIDHARCSLSFMNGRADVLHYGESLDHLDAIIPRIGASVTALGAAVIQQFDAMGIYSPTPAQALLDARDKLRSTQLLNRAGVPCPKTMMVTRLSNLEELVPQLGGYPVVVKLLESTHGLGVELADNLWHLRRILQSFYQYDERVLLQEYIAEAAGADVRALMVDGKLVAAMKRQAKAGEFRSNLHRGASSELVTLDKRQVDLVHQVVEVMNIPLAGVDIIHSDRGPLVMEVNASPGLEGIEGTTGVDVAGQIIKMVEQKCF